MWCPNRFNRKRLLRRFPTGPQADVSCWHALTGAAVLREELEKAADIHQVAVYRNSDVEALPEYIVRRFESGTVDWVTLTSSAIAARLHTLLPESARGLIGGRVRLATLSPVTSATVIGLGWAVAVEASVSTWEGLVSSLVERVAEEAQTAMIGWGHRRLSAWAAIRARSAKLENRLDPLPEQERAAENEQDVHRDVPAEDSRNQVEQEKQANQPGDSHRRISDDLLGLHRVTLR